MNKTDREILQILNDGRAAKKTYGEIAVILNERSFLTATGKPWSSSHVSNFAVKNHIRKKRPYTKAKRPPEVLPLFPPTEQQLPLNSGDFKISVIRAVLADMNLLNEHQRYLVSLVAKDII